MSERRFPAPAQRPGAPKIDKDSAPARQERAPDTNTPPKQGRAAYGKPREPWKTKTTRPAKSSGAGYGPKSAPPVAETDARQNEEDDKTLQPGLKPVLELLERDPSKVDTVFVLKGRRDKDTDAILDLCRAASVRFNLVDSAFLDRLWPGRHQGVLARLLTTGFSDLATVLEKARSAPLPLVLALDQVQDPGNAGTLARTLYAFGGGGLVVPRHNGVYLGAAAAKASAGALEQLAVSKVTNLGQALDTAEEAGFTIYGAASLPKEGAEGQEKLRSLFVDAFSFKPELPAVLVLGGEEGGLRPTIAKRCAALLHIPLVREFDSLNVAQAGAVIMACFAASQGKQTLGGRK